MDLHDLNLDWGYIRSFLAVAESGSLSAAARETGQSQPTLGRHIKAVERALGTTLFVRVPNGLRLTDEGLSLLEPAKEMAAAAARLSMLAAGRDDRLSGTVRITASKVVSHYILPEFIQRIRTAESEIEIELVPSDTSENLYYRDADIALRMYRPTQLDIVTRKIGDFSIALYGSCELIATLEVPKSPDDFAQLPMVGYDRSDLIIRAMRGLGFDVDRHFFSVRCDDQAAYWELVRAGCGIGAMQSVVGDSDPQVARLAFQPELPKLPMWIAAHESLHRTPRVKRVWDLLISDLTRFAKRAP